MLIRKRVLERIRDGDVTLAFRRWRRPTVRTGGTLLTWAGQLEIRDVARVAPDTITSADAGLAGYPSRDALLAELAARADGDVYRIEFGRLRADPRQALRDAPIDSEQDHRDLLDRLRRMDARASRPWTQETLRLIAAHPGVAAAQLCRRLDQARDPFKRNVRRLKALGLTESLPAGYRLSRRGAALLAFVAR